MEALADTDNEAVPPASEVRTVAPPFAVTLGLFVFSGATGLVDQLCFSKYLTYIVGSTAYAVSAVLAAFMTGLAIGAHFGGRISPRVRSPLLAYGVLELVVALAVLLTPFAFEWLTPLYAAVAQKLPNSLATLSVLRWGVALFLVVVPTMAMGATLPLLSRSLEGDATLPNDRERQRRLNALYAINTLGGAAGALLAAYAILPALGVDGTIFASAAVSAAVGVVAVLFGRHLQARAGTDLPPVSQEVALLKQPGATEARLLYVLSFASGSLVFAAEVVFTHLLALIIGNSAYAFGLILAVFLSCLFVGATRASWADHKFGDAALPLGLAVTGAALAFTLPIWDKLPLLFNNTGKVLTTFAMREATRGVTAFLALCIPTTLMGLTFPLLLQRAARYSQVGRWVGRLTAINTIGAVAGALLTGYVILPALGSQRSLLAVSFAFLAASLLVVRWAEARKVWVLGLSGATLVLSIVAPRWDLGRLTSGSNVYFDGYHEPDNIVMVREDVHGGVTSVTRKDGVSTLYTNGKFQGNTGWEMKAQRFFAHYPSLFVKDFDKALVIGLGTGTTLGTIAAYPWEKIDVAEISPSILEAARTHFVSVNRNALEDPRVAVHHADGRNYLLVQNEQYDLISMELSSIWFAGASSLYSAEFYELLNTRLREGGIFQQWVQLHHITRKDFATIVNTLRQKFAHVALFYGGGQGILVASQKPLQASVARVHSLQQSAAITEIVPEGQELIELLSHVLVVDAGLDRFLAESAKEAGEPVTKMVSTDRNLYLEYATPRGNVLPWSARDELVADIRKHRDFAAIAALRVP